MKKFTDNGKIFSVPWGDWGTCFILGVCRPQVSRSPVWFPMVTGSVASVHTTAAIYLYASVPPREE